ncbi:11080_t:CDS:1, partial [Racocetra persica]
MPRISKKLTIGGRVSCKASILPKEIIQQQHLQQRGRNWKNLCLYGTIISELTSRKCRKYQVSFEEFENVTVDILAGNLRYEKQAILNQEELAVTELSPTHEEFSDDSESSLDEEEAENNEEVIDLSTTINWQEQPVTIDQRAVNLAYNYECKINISSISLASPYELFRQYLPLDYIEQSVINSINIRGRDTSNWVYLNINEYMRWLGLWVLMFVFPVADRYFYWRADQEHTQPLAPFNFQCWMSRTRFEQIVSCHTLIALDELNNPNLTDPLYPVRSFINVFNSNLIDAVLPG